MPFYVKALSGVLSGAMASGICNPTDVVKIRMQADGMGKDKGHAPRYRGLAHAFSTIWRDEGLKGLYKGVSPTTQVRLGCIMLSMPDCVCA